MTTKPKPQKRLKLRGTNRRRWCKCGTPMQASTTGRCWDCDDKATREARS